MSKLTRFFWRIFYLGIISFTFLIVAINYELLGEMPSMEEIENPSSAMSSEVYSSDGVLLGNYFIQNRSNSEFEEISPNVFNALIATEDERFYEHSGIDGRAIMRAVVLMGKRGGGSTITQQLALNLFAERSDNKFVRVLQKLKEWILAVKLEKNLTKQEIITLYLNTVPFSDNVYGIKNASLTFFSKSPDKLSVDEAAVLIGMLKGNTIYNPRRNPERSLNRRNTVIDQMLNANFLSQADANKYKNEPLVLKYKKQSHNEGLAPYFRQVIEQEIKKWSKTNKKANGEYYNIYKDGLKIYTTLDTRLQSHAEDAVEEHMKSLQVQFAAQPQIKNGTIWTKGKPKEALENWIKRSERYINLKDQEMSDTEIMKVFKQPTEMQVFNWKSTNYIKDTVMTPLDSIKYTRAFLQAGFMVMDPYNGEIKAWVGGINHKFFQYDHVNIGTKRQVGSTIKPLLYCMALDNGYTPCSSLSSAPQLFKGQKKPYNAGGSGGNLRMDMALAKSINNSSLYLLNQLGIKNFVDFCHNQGGITSNIEEVPSIALGVSDISLFEMLGAYTMFPNRGIRTEPVFISKIEDKNGNVIFSATPKQREVINEETAFRMVDMMQGVTQGGGTATRLRYRYGLEGEMAGKTGTTNNQADAWYIGYTPQLLAGVWVGCDDRFLRFSSTAQGQGASAALPIWAYFFKKIYADKNSGYSSQEKFIAPNGYTKCGGSSLSGSNFYTNDYSDEEAEELGWEEGEDGSVNTPSTENITPQTEKPKTNTNKVEIPIEEW